MDILLREPFTDNEEATIIEINQSAEIGLHLYPAYGDGKYPPRDILDLYFPEHPRKVGSEYWYFDLAKIFSIIRARVAESVVVNPMPEPSRLEWSRVTVAGRVQGVGFRKWVVRKANDLGIHGTVMNTRSGEVRIDLCGRRRELQKLKESIQAGLCPGEVTEMSSAPSAEFTIVPGMKIISTPEN